MAYNSPILLVPLPNQKLVESGPFTTMLEKQLTFPKFIDRVICLQAAMSQLLAGSASSAGKQTSAPAPHGPGLPWTHSVPLIHIVENKRDTNHSTSTSTISKTHDILRLKISYQVGVRFHRQGCLRGSQTLCSSRRGCVRTCRCGGRLIVLTCYKRLGESQTGKRFVLCASNSYYLQNKP